MMKKQGLLTLAIVICLFVCLFTACSNTSNSGGGKPNNSGGTPDCTHTSTRWITDEEATCTTDGSKHKECSSCGKTLDTESISAKGHDYYELVVPSTEEKQGYTLHQCSRCNDSYKDNFVELSTFTIHFNSMGGSEVADIVLQEDDIFVLPDDPTKEGYAFAGWYLDESMQTIFESTSQLSDGIILYAKWQPKQIKLSLDANGGKLTQNEVYVNYNEEYQLPVPSANEDIFKGWYYQGTQLTTYDGYSINNLTFDTDIVVTAQYEVFTGSRGLSYSHTEDGYIITGIGTCKDSNIKFPEMYNGEPVVEIKSNAFESNTNIYQIVLSKTIKMIGAYSFAKCSNLQRVTIPQESELRRIDDYAFWNSNLTYINLEDAQNLYNINWYAFCNCKMRTIIIPKSVTHMAARVFIGCTYLQTIYCEISSKPENWNNYWLGGSPSSSDNSKINATVIWGY